MRKSTAIKPRLISKNLEAVRLVSLRPLKDRWRLDAIMDAVSAVELKSTEAWNDLNKLSSHARVVGIEAVPGGVFLTESGTGFAAAATVYVDLNDGGNESFVSSDSFPAEVRGHIETDGHATIDAISVDTSSFDG
jgi:hypothetical protein